MLWQKMLCIDARWKAPGHFQANNIEERKTWKFWKIHPIKVGIAKTRSNEVRFVDVKKGFLATKGFFKTLILKSAFLSHEICKDFN